MSMQSDGGAWRGAGAVTLLALGAVISLACLGGGRVTEEPDYGDTWDLGFPPDDDDDTKWVEDTDEDTVWDTGVDPLDFDGDGVPRSDDCNDFDSTVGRRTLGYYDADGDGFGVGDEFLGCFLVRRDGDCAPYQPSIYPGAPESCDNPTVDSNCDGFLGFEDNDGDGYYACEDCDDRTDVFSPGAREIWDSGQDEDCNPDTPDRPCEGGDQWASGLAESPEPGLGARFTFPVDEPELGAYTFCVASQESVTPRGRFVLANGAGVQDIEGWYQSADGTWYTRIDLDDEPALGIVIIEGSEPGTDELAAPFQVVVGAGYEP